MKFVHIYFAVFIILLAVQLRAEEMKNVDLDKYQWKNRLVLLFAPSSDFENYHNAVAELARLSDEIDDRDLVVFHLFENDKSHVYENEMSSRDVQQLAEKYDPKKGALTTILIGKDGGEKYRQTGQTEWQEIFDRIDAMPMRRAEMRAKEK
jgi:hypothetical protein